MSDNLEEIIKLSSHPWIQGQWSPKFGDYYYMKEHSAFGSHIGILNGTQIIHGISIAKVLISENDNKWWGMDNVVNISEITWLPVGVNLETGEHQIDELLDKLNPGCDIEGCFIAKLHELNRMLINRDKQASQDKKE